MAKVKFPKTFWVANTLEIFERMAWYGFFAVASLYITGKVSDGGLGFSDEDRGLMVGLVTFFLYLFPVLTGSLADRYGFKKMLIIAFSVLAPSYYFLGVVKSFPAFFTVFMLVAVGAAIFKPVIVGTVSKVTTKETSSMGFGIFYMMVNIGGFVGPIIAGIVRAMSWKYVFMASGGWILLNLLLVILFYKEPKVEGQAKDVRSLKKVFTDMVEVLGNGRFFLFIFGIFVLLVLGSKLTTLKVVTWNQITAIAVLWFVLNILYDFVLKKAKLKSKSWLITPMKLGDWRFGLFLLLMSGFWTSFNQIFYTLPLQIRDFVDTSDIYSASIAFFHFFGIGTEWFRNMMETKGQINPEYLINVDAGAIIVFQVLVSYLIRKLKPFTTIFWGTIITAGSFAMLIFGTTGWIVLAGIFIFAIGEMMASPKSQEYTGKIAPRNKVALYMGYFFWCVALGNLFGGILSGQLYAYYARDMQRPDLMWLVFAILAFVTAILIFFYDRLILRKHIREEQV